GTAICGTIKHDIDQARLGRAHRDLVLVQAVNEAQSYASVQNCCWRYCQANPGADTSSKTARTDLLVDREVRRMSPGGRCRDPHRHTSVAVWDRIEMAIAISDIHVVLHGDVTA